jgi:hypothetical protein
MPDIAVAESIVETAGSAGGILCLLALRVQVFTGGVAEGADSDIGRVCIDMGEGSTQPRFAWMWCRDPMA